MSKNAESRFTIRAIDKTQRVFTNIRKGLNGIAKQAKIFAAGGALTFSGFAANGLAAADALAKMSDQSQLATESVQATRLAMELAGGSAQGLDKSIVQMNKNIGIAIRDGGSYERVFESLGLRSQELANLGTDEAFARIGEAISKLPTAAEKSAAALQIFGRQGREMLTLFKDGRAGIDAARRDIEELGLAMSRVDAAKVEIANDQLTRLNQVGRGASQVLAVQLAPVIDAFASSLLGAAKEAGGLDTVMQNVVTFGAKGFAMLGNVFRGWENIVKGGQVVFVGFGEGVTYILLGVAQTFENLINGVLVGVNKAIDALNKLPKVDIEQVGFGGFEATGKLEEFAETMRQSRVELQDALTESVIAQLPTERVDEWLAQIREKMQIAAEEIAMDSDANIELAHAEETREKLKEIQDGQLADTEKFVAEKNKVLSNSNGLNDLLTATEQFAGKQSGIYKAMFAVSKAFAIKDSIVSITQGIAKAASLPFPANLGAMATVAASTAGLVSTIQGTNLSFEGGGSFNVRGSRMGGADGRGGVPFMAHPGENVQVTDLRKGNAKSDGKTIVQNITINGRLTEDEKRETIEIASELGAQKADSMIASTMRSGDGESARTMEEIYGMRRGLA